MIRTHRVSSERVAIVLEGTFDAAEAWHVHDVLTHLAPATRVWLDFREVRAFHDFAIALLAKDFLSLRGYVEATGLCQHQRRMLRYFGVDEVGLGDALAVEAPDRELREDAALGA